MARTTRSALTLGRPPAAPLPLTRILDVAAGVPEFSPRDAELQQRALSAVMESRVLQPALEDGGPPDHHEFGIAMAVAYEVDAALEAVGA